MSALERCAKKMITSDTAAGLVFGMLQGSDGIGQVIDQLPQRDCSALIQSWKIILASGAADPAQEIIETIEEHPTLSSAWAALSDRNRECRLGIIEIIKGNIEDPANDGIS